MGAMLSGCGGTDCICECRVVRCLWWGGAKLHRAARLGALSRALSATAVPGARPELPGPADEHRLWVKPGSLNGARFGQRPGLSSVPSRVGHERIGGRLGVPVRDRPVPGVFGEGHPPLARPRPKSPPFVTILSPCRQEPSRLSWISSGTRSSPRSWSRRSPNPGHEGAARGPCSMVSSPPPAVRR